MSTMRTLGLLFALGIAACYSPDLSNVHYTCDETNPYCPDGQDCIGGTCQAPGSAATTQPAPDGGVAGSGCRYGGGTDLGGGVFACPGLFNSKLDAIPLASQLCADAYAICKTPGSADINRCKSLPGFFAADVLGNRIGNNVDANSMVCAPSTSRGAQPVWSGCGRTSKNEIVEKTCGGWPEALDCYAVKTWQCYGDAIDNSENTNARDGVLCCKP